MSTMRVTNLKHENSASNNIVLNSDGSVGGDLATTLASKLPYSYGTATPSTTDSGFLWYDSNSTPAAPKFWDGAAFTDFPNGLTLISKEVFSGVSSVSINGAITSSFENYRVVWIASGTSATSAVQLRLRSGGSDFSTGIYNQRNISADAGGLATGAATTSTEWQIGQAAGASALKAGSFDLFATTTVYSRIVSQAMNGENELRIVGGWINNAASVDGLSLLISAGTFSGEVSIYGYKE